MRSLAALALLALVAPGLSAQQDWPKGPIFTDFGPVAPVTQTFPTPTNIDYKVAFDVTEGGPTDGTNFSIETAARFMNMHARAGVPRNRIATAIVVHGPAVLDLLTNEQYNARKGVASNPNAELIRQLLAEGTELIVCGQSAAGQNVTQADLLPGVTMALSAMTAFVILQERGYKVNPW
jgi:intracellular sulfur oxidation DsrE/DsrF family protein